MYQKCRSLSVAGTAMPACETEEVAGTPLQYPPAQKSMEPSWAGTPQAALQSPIHSQPTLVTSVQAEPGGGPFSKLPSLIRASGFCGGLMRMGPAGGRAPPEIERLLGRAPGGSPFSAETTRAADNSTTRRARAATE